jgi:membrane protease YdiL (CAAX protease family)
LSYSAHQNFISPARPRSELWRTAVGLILSALVYVFSLALTGLQPPAEGFSPSHTLLVLYSFFFMGFGPAVALIILHDRHPATLFGDFDALKRHLWTAIKAMLLLKIAVMLLPPYSDAPADNEVIANLAFGTWLSLLPFALIGLLIQTGAEEVLFRGYIQQQLAARFSSPILWMGLPAIIFASLHFDPANGENAWVIVVWAGLFSLAASDLTARTGNLGAAIGFHLVNNAFGMLLVSYPGMMSGLSLFVLRDGPGTFAPGSTQILAEYVTLLISWLAIRVAVRR